MASLEKEVIQGIERCKTFDIMRNYMNDADIEMALNHLSSLGFNFDYLILVSNYYTYIHLDSERAATSTNAAIEMGTISEDTHTIKEPDQTNIISKSTHVIPSTGM